MQGPSSPWKAVSLVSLIGLDIAICTILGAWVGRKVDMYFGTAPWWMIVGLLLGMCLGMLTLIPIIRRFLGAHDNE